MGQAFRNTKNSVSKSSNENVMGPDGQFHEISASKERESSQNNAQPIAVSRNTNRSNQNISDEKVYVPKMPGN